MSYYSISSGKDPNSSRRTRIAENPSPYSDISLRVYHPSGAWRNIAAYGAVLREENGEFWTTDEEVKYFASLCYRFNYNGKWRIFQEILEETTNYKEFEEICIKKFGTHSFFGNLKPLIDLYQRTILKVDKVNRNRKINKPKRKRGYDDKGSLRPHHQKYRNLPQKEKEDRRTKVAHYLLKEEKFSEDGSMPLDHVLNLTPERREESYDPKRR